MVAGGYTIKAVQTQVTLQGAAGRETWLGVDLLRRGGRGKVTGWMQSAELQERVAGNDDWLARLRGKGREGWGVGGTQLDGQWQPSSGRAWAEGSSGGVVHASAGGR